MTDSDLLRRYAETGAEDAFAEIVRRHVDGVYSAAWRRMAGDAHLAEDVTQLVFLTLAQKAKSLVEHPVLTSWLHVATRHECANLVRRERRRKAVEQEAQTMHEILARAEPDADWNRVAPVLDDVIDELNDRDRAAVLLRFVDRQPFAAIGAALQLSEDGARMRVERALDKLRVRLARRGITSTAAVLGTALANHAVMAAPAGLAASVTGSALAGAGTVASPLAGIIQFMTTTKTVTAAAGLAIVLCATVATREVSAYHAAKDAQAAALRQDETMAGAVQTARRRADALEQERLGVERELSAAQAARAAAAQGGRAASPAARPAGVSPTVVELTDAERNALGRAFLKGNATAREILDDNTRLGINYRFLPLMSELGLGPEKIAELRATWSRLGGMSFGNVGGLSINFPAADGGDPLTRPEVEARLQATLGEEDYRRYQDYERILGARQLAEQVGALVYASETPLTETQARQLTQVFAQNNPSYQSGRGFSGSTLEWDAVIRTARGFLAESQIAALAGVREQQRYQQALSKARGEAHERWSAAQAAQLPRK